MAKPLNPKTLNPKPQILKSRKPEHTQRLHNPLIQEYALNHIRDPIFFRYIP